MSDWFVAMGVSVVVVIISAIVIFGFALLIAEVIVPFLMEGPLP